MKLLTELSKDQMSGSPLDMKEICKQTKAHTFPNYIPK